MTEKRRKALKELAEQLRDAAEQLHTELSAPIEELRGVDVGDITDIDAELRDSLTETLDSAKVIREYRKQWREGQDAMMTALKGLLFDEFVKPNHCPLIIQRILTRGPDRAGKTSIGKEGK